MDLDAISGPRIPDDIHTPASSNSLEPVENKSRVRRITERASPYEDLERWMIEDKVTISPEARRRYRAMRTTDKDNLYKH
ncbi:MAG: hypothetical protein AB1499_06240 [Nitrospirota bacterium]